MIRDRFHAARVALPFFAMLRRLACVCFAVVLCCACGPRSGSKGASSSHDSTSSDDGTKVETKTVKNPDGSVTVITTTTKMVAAPDPPDRPADGWPGDPLVKYNVDQLNVYRKNAGVGPLKYDAKISAYAMDGSKQLSVDHTAHAHFVSTSKDQMGVDKPLGTKAEENQGDWNGVPELVAGDKIANGKKQIDVMLKIMFDEGPGGGHHDNMLNPKMKRVGIGLFYAGGKLYLTNDFSN
jgi:hypothetical protein